MNVQEVRVSSWLSAAAASSSRSRPRMARGPIALPLPGLTPTVLVQAGLLAARVDRQEAAARLVLRCLNRRKLVGQLAAWRKWTATASAEGMARERSRWRLLAARQLVRELGRVVEGRRLSVLRGSVGLWRSKARGLADLSAVMARQAGDKEAGARRLHAVLERNLLRRKARVWARLLGTAVATCERLQRERDSEAQRERLLGVARARSARRKLGVAWLAWKDAWVARKHRGEVGVLHTLRGAAGVAAVTRRKELEALRRGLSLWRAQARQARRRERAVSKVMACSLRAEARSQRARASSCLLRWRLWSARQGKALAEESKASTEAALRARAILVILERRRQRRLGEGFRRLILHSSSVVFGTRQEQARREHLGRALRSLGRMVARRGQREAMRALTQWRCFAAEAGQLSDRVLLRSIRRRSGVQALCAVLSHREKRRLSRAWTLWRSGAASAAIHDGERASADLRVGKARHSAGMRLLSMTLSAARRKSLVKAWGVWRTEVRAAAEAEFHLMEKHFHLARTLTRVERRAQLARMSRVWRVWTKHVRAVNCLTRAARGVRRAQLAGGMARWRLACHRRRQAEADEARASAESALRARAVLALVQRQKMRQLKDGFEALFHHGAWAIYGHQQQAARLERVARGSHALARLRARRHERRKLAMFGRWRRLSAEGRMRDDRALVYAANLRAGAKALASLVSRRQHSSAARAWTTWRAGAASAAVHEDERASAEQRVIGARRSAGARLLSAIYSAAKRRALARSWAQWCTAAKAVADARLHNTEKHARAARALARVERRADLARLGRAWRSWGEFVRLEWEAEVRLLERHFHVAQVVKRVTGRAHMRRLVRAWGLWARLAARGRPRVRFPVEARARARSAAMQGPPAVPSASGTAGGAGTSSRGAVADVGQRERAEQSRRVRHRAAAVAVRGLVRRADARSLGRSWGAWRAVVEAEAAQEARFVVGATRLATLLAAAVRDHQEDCLRRSWGAWVAWSAEEAERLQQAAEAESWAVAEAKRGEAVAGAKGEVLTAFVGVWESKLLRWHFLLWNKATASEVHDSRELGSGRLDVFQGRRLAADSPGVGASLLEDSNAREEEPGCNEGETASVSPVPGLLELQRKLRGGWGSSPSLPVPPEPSLDPNQSPRMPSPVEGAAMLASSGTFSLVPNVVKPSVSHPTGPGAAQDGEARSPGAIEEAWWVGESCGTSPALSDLRFASPTMYSPCGAIAAGTRPRVTPATLDKSGSLELSASTASVGVGVGVGLAAFDPFAARGEEASPAECAAAAGTSIVVPTEAIAGSQGSLTHASESPLLGESVARSRSQDIAEDGDGALLSSFSQKLPWIRDDGEGDGKGDGEGVDWDGAADGHHQGKGAEEGKSVGSGGTPPRSRRLTRALSSTREEGRGARCRTPLRERSPPYVPGSVHTSPSKPLSPLDAYEDHVVFAESRVGVPREIEDMEALGRPTSEDGSETQMSDAEAFLWRIKLVFWRRGFKRWVRIHRSAMYERRMSDATKKVGAGQPRRRLDTRAAVE